MKALKSIFLLTLVLVFAVSSTYAGSGKVNFTGDKDKKAIASKKLKGVKVLDKIPVMDKGICAMDLKFDLVVTGKTVQLINKSTGEFSDMEVIFGDGEISSDIDGKYTYEKSGIYYIAVSMFNDETGCMDFVGGNVYLDEDAADKEVVIAFEDFNNSEVANLTAK